MDRKSWSVRLTALSLGALAFGAASCGGGPEPLTSTQLQNRLLTAATAPHGVDVRDVGDASDRSAATSSPAALQCGDLVGMGHVLFGDPSAVPVGRASVSLNAGSGRGMWSGIEWLTSYRDGDAHRAVSDLKALVKKCPSVHTPADAQVSLGNISAPATTDTFSLLAGPRLGDESVLLRDVLQLDGINGHGVKDTYLIRSGNTLITVASTLLSVQLPPAVAGTAAVAAFNAVSHQ